MTSSGALAVTDIADIRATLNGAGAADSTIYVTMETAAGYYLINIVADSTSALSLDVTIKNVGLSCQYILLATS